MMLLLAVAGVLVACSLLGSLYYLFMVVAPREGGLWWMRRVETEVKDLVAEECSTCGGMGALWFVDGKLRKIPAELRQQYHQGGQPKDRVMQAKRLGNLRTCRDCQGKEFNWVPRTTKTVTTLPLAPDVPFDEMP